MSYLDAHVPVIHKASANFATATESMRAIISTAEQQAQASQAFNKGEHSAAFQAAHARFVDSTNKVRELLRQASDHVQRSGATYTHADSAAAHNINQTITH